jgi:lysophospholipase L1-like esterase
VFGEQIFVREPVMRIVDGVPLWDHKEPRYDRGDIRRASQDRGAFKILGLGDSIMYGVWQTKDATYLEVARRELATRARQRVDIINMAVPGYNTLQEATVYKEIDDQLKPDLVLVHYWIDDSHQYRAAGGYVVDFGNVPDDGQLVAQPLPVPPTANDFLLVHSRLYDLMTQAVVAYRRQSRSNDFGRVAAPLADIQQRVQRAGGRLVVLVSPMLSGVYPESVNDLAALRQFAATRGIEAIDLTEWVRGVPTGQIAIDQCHFNTEGHRLIGVRLAEYLLEHDLASDHAS